MVFSPRCDGAAERTTEFCFCVPQKNQVKQVFWYITFRKSVPNHYVINDTHCPKEGVTLQGLVQIAGWNWIVHPPPSSKKVATYILCWNWRKWWQFNRVSPVTDLELIKHDHMKGRNIILSRPLPVHGIFYFSAQAFCTVNRKSMFLSALSDTPRLPPVTFLGHEIQSGISPWLLPLRWKSNRKEGGWALHNSCYGNYCHHPTMHLVQDRRVR